MLPETDTLLEELLRTCRHVVRVRSDVAPESEVAAEAVEVARAVLALHARLVLGAPLPRAWARDGHGPLPARAWLRLCEPPPPDEES